MTTQKRYRSLAAQYTGVRDPKDLDAIAARAFEKQCGVWHALAEIKSERTGNRIECRCAVCAPTA